MAGDEHKLNNDAIVRDLDAVIAERNRLRSQVAAPEHIGVDGLREQLAGELAELRTGGAES